MFKSYLLLNADAMPAALDRIGGQIHADAVAVGLSSHRLFSRTLNDRLRRCAAARRWPNRQPHR